LNAYTDIGIVVGIKPAQGIRLLNPTLSSYA